MDRINDLRAVATNHAKSFLGYGNPNSNILIIGKECGFEVQDSDPCEKEFYRITYLNNALSWRKFCAAPIESSQIPDWKKTTQKEWESNFSPRFAFRGQFYTTQNVIGCTSKTWYMYQKLLDLHRGVSRFRGNWDPFGNRFKDNPDLLDFQDLCFITEFNSHPMKRSHHSFEVKQSINTRINGLFKESFFQSFPLIIAASKGYVTRYQIDLRALFPNSRIIVTNQLSIMPRKGYLEEIVDKIEGNEEFCIV